MTETTSREALYFQQFFDDYDNGHGTRFHARIHYRGGANGVAFNCLSIEEAKYKAIVWLSGYGHFYDDVTIEILEDRPDGYDRSVVPPYIPDFSEEYD